MKQIQKKSANIFRHTSQPIIVLKIGGTITENEPVMRRIAHNLLNWQNNGSRLLVVHGGNAAITRLQEKFAIKPHFMDGIRITEKNEMPLVDMALCGAINKSLVRLFRSEGLDAWGISGSDAGIFLAARPEGITPNQHTGIVQSVNTRPIHTLWQSRYLPILAPPAADEAGLPMNINADDAALSLASTLQAAALILVSDVEAVLDKGIPVPCMDRTMAEQMIKDGRIHGGMIPKIRSCMKALEEGVGAVHIGTCNVSGNLDDLLSGQHGTLMENAGKTSPKTGKMLQKQSANQPEHNEWEENLPFPPQYGSRLQVISWGQGSRLYDRSGREYIDLASGIAVNSLGYGRTDLAETARAQMERLIHISNLFTTEPQLRLARKILESAQSLGDFQSVHFGNSGSEANEAAMKYARLYAQTVKGKKHSRLIAFSNGFHGRTMGSLSLTCNKTYRKPFEPLLPHVKFLPFNNSRALEKALGKHVAAVIVEPIQGEGGLESLDKDFASRLNTLCRRHNIILIADEVQTGLGRCGELFASSIAGLQPDIITLAKPLAAGLPLSATLLRSKVNQTVKPGHHGSTFGGGPVSSAVALNVWTMLSSPARLEENRRKGTIMAGLLERVLKKLDVPGELRGNGMLRGLQINLPQCGPQWCQSLIQAAREEGVFILRSGKNVIRFAPPLLIEDDLLKEGIMRFHTVMERQLHS